MAASILPITYNNRSFQVIYVQKLEDIKPYLPEIKTYKKLGIDIETAKKAAYEGHKQSGLCPHLSDIRLLQIYGGGDKVFIFDIFDIDIQKLVPLLQKRTLIAHNALFELKHITQKAGCENLDLHCTMIMYAIWIRALSPESAGVRFGLDAAVKHLFNVRIDKNLQISNWNGVLKPDQIQYAAIDAIATFDIFDTIDPKLEKLGLKASYKLLKDFLPVVSEMELTGILLDIDKHAGYVDKHKEERKKLDISIKKTFADLNLNSNAQFSKWVKDNVPVNRRVNWERTNTGMYKGDTATLDNFQDIPAIKLLADWRGYSKKLNTYGEGLTNHIHPITGRIHPSYSITNTRTGRLSSSNPNSQNMPRDLEFRELFIAGKDRKLIIADYSQIETRAQAEFSRDPVMLKAYNEGLDLYKLFASKMYRKDYDKVTKQERQISKSACFTGDTEVLTKKGWVRFDEYNFKDPIAQYHVPDWAFNCGDLRSGRRFGFRMQGLVWDGKGKIDFVSPIGCVTHKNQEVWNIKDRGTDVAITPDHRVLYRTAEGNAKVEKLEDCHYIHSLVTSGYYNNRPLVEDKIVRIIAMCIADGSFTSNGHIRLGFVKRRKHRRCRQLLLDAGYIVPQKTKKAKTSTGFVTNFVIKDAGLVGIVSKYVTKDKSPSWSAIDDFNLEVFLEEAAYWDSSVQHLEGKDVCTFGTTNKQTADVMQAMLHLRLKQATISVEKSKKEKHSDVYRLRYSHKEEYLHALKSTKKVNKKYTRTDVYCVEVPSGFILTRRNGKVCVMGNCLGLSYGMGANKLVTYAKGMGVDLSTAQAEVLWNNYHTIFKVYSKWCNMQRNFWIPKGYVRTRLGRIRKFPMENGEYRGYTECVNTIVQGSCFELLAIAMIHFFKKKHKSTRIIISVHDEFHALVNPELAEQEAGQMKASMEWAMLKIFPKASLRDLVNPIICDNWGEAK